MSTVMHRPPQKHRCDVGWSERAVVVPGDDVLDSGTLLPVPPGSVMIRGQWDRPGTVRACDECGQTWKAHRYQDPPGGGYSSKRVEWRRESRLARWWRERKQR
jgi:hypothetical protein